MTTIICWSIWNTKSDQNASPCSCECHPSPPEPHPAHFYLFRPCLFLVRQAAGQQLHQLIPPAVIELTGHVFPPITNISASPAYLPHLPHLAQWAYHQQQQQQLLFQCGKRGTDQGTALCGCECRPSSPKLHHIHSISLGTACSLRDWQPACAAEGKPFGDTLQQQQELKGGGPGGGGV